MANVILHFEGGGTSIIPENNLENTRRLLGSKIVGIEYEGKEMANDLIAAIDKEVIIELVEDETKPLTMADLLNSDKDVLRKMADDIADKQGIAKANGRAGIDKLADYIYNATN